MKNFNKEILITELYEKGVCEEVIHLINSSTTLDELYKNLSDNCELIIQKKLNVPNGVYYNTYATGELMEKLTVEDNIKVYEIKYKNGIIKERYTTINGKINGLHVKRLYDGKLESLTHYNSLGKTLQVFVSQFMDGWTKEVTRFKYGKRNGLYQVLRKGKLIESTNYLGGKKHGLSEYTTRLAIYTEYYEYGKLVHQEKQNLTNDDSKTKKHEKENSSSMG